MARLAFDFRGTGSFSHSQATALSDAAAAFVKAWTEAGGECRGNGLDVVFDDAPKAEAPKPEPKAEPKVEPKKPK